MRPQPWAWRWTRNGLVAGMAGWGLWKVPASKLWIASHSFKPGWVAGALLFSSIMLVVRCAKWHLLLSESQFTSGRREAARSLLGSYALGTISPGRLGDFARFAFVEEAMRGRVLLATFLDKAFDIWAVLSFAALSLFWLAPRPVALSVAALWLALLPLFGRFPAALQRFRRFPARRRNLLDQVSRASEMLRTVCARRYGLWALAAGAADLLTLFCLLHALRPVHPFVALATYPWLVIAGAFPISVGGLGPREVVSAMILPRFFVPVESAISISLLFYLLTVLLPAILGGVWYLARYLARPKAQAASVVPIAAEPAPATVGSG